MAEKFEVNAKTILEFMDKYPEGSAMDFVAWLVRQEWAAEEAETQAKILDSLTEGDLADPDLFEKLNEIQEKRNTLKESLDEADKVSVSEDFEEYTTPVATGVVTPLNFEFNETEFRNSV